MRTLHVHPCGVLNVLGSTTCAFWATGSEDGQKGEGEEPREAKRVLILLSEDWVPYRGISCQILHRCSQLFTVVHSFRLCWKKRLASDLVRLRLYDSAAR